MLFDSHAHLDDAKFDEDRAAVLDRACSAGVLGILNPGCELDSSKRAVELAAEYDMVYAAVGVHPHDAAGRPADYLDRLEALARREKVVALGEIGLDYFRNFSPRNIQRKVFREQLALARELNLPVIIHDRDAHEDIVQILKKDGLPERGGVMHCFSGDWSLAETCLKMGLYISFAGTVTFADACGLRGVAAGVPLEKILVETDAPYLAPHPRRGRRNEPACVRYVAEKIAELKNIKLEKLDGAIVENMRTLFDISIAQTLKQE